MKSYFFLFSMRNFFSSKLNETSLIRDQYCHLADDGSPFSRNCFLKNAWIIRPVDNIINIVTTLLSSFGSPWKELKSWNHNSRVFVIALWSAPLKASASFRRSWVWIPSSFSDYDKATTFSQTSTDLLHQLFNRLIYLEVWQYQYRPSLSKL